MLLRRLTALLSFVTVFHLAMAAPSRACSGHDAHAPVATAADVAAHDHGAMGQDTSQPAPELPCDRASTECCPPTVSCTSGVLIAHGNGAAAPVPERLVVAGAVVNTVPTPATGPEPPPPKIQVSL